MYVEIRIARSGDTLLIVYVENRDTEHTGLIALIQPAQISMNPPAPFRLLNEDELAEIEKRPDLLRVRIDFGVVRYGI